MNVHHTDPYVADTDGDGVLDGSEVTMADGGTCFPVLRWLSRRVRTRLGGDAALVRVAQTLRFTWPGVPRAYQGDEVGLEGGHDPDNRRSMPWDESSGDTGLRDHGALPSAARDDRTARNESGMGAPWRDRGAGWCSS